LISTGDLKKGVIIEMDGQLFTIMDYQHLKIGRGSAQVRMKLRNVRTGAVIDRTVQSGEKWPHIRLEHRKVNYSYEDPPNYVFMDQDTFDQIMLSKEQLGEAVHYLMDGMELEIVMHENEPIGVELPITVDLRIEQTDPGFRGDTASGGTKPATLETGLVVNVPLFVNTGEVIRIDTRTGTYLERVSS
jgi:elongation factor P